jgi:hypothetical protein
MLKEVREKLVSTFQIYDTQEAHAHT